MIIETKYTLGQKVWGIYGNKVQEFLVESIEVVCTYSYDTYTPCVPSTKYKIRIGESTGSRLEVYEYELERYYALSKEELLKTL